MNRELLNILNLPTFSNWVDVANSMRLDPTRLESIVTNIDLKHYKVYHIPKRKGGLRTIEQPTMELKAAQAWILRNILDNLHPSGNATAYRKETPLTANLEPHKFNRYFLCMDIEDFFPSIGFSSVYNVFTVIGYDKLVAWFLARICTRRGHLPQGGVTSPMLSNITCIRLDKRISGLCSKRNLVYTRYADDITISTNHPSALKAIIPTMIKILNSEGFQQNQSKMKLLGPNNGCTITGLTKNSTTPTYGIGVRKKRAMRAKMFRFLVKRIRDEDYPTRESFEGWLSYLKGVDPSSFSSMSAYWNRLLERVSSNISG